MRAFIQSAKGIPKSHNYYIAEQGFREMGFETLYFQDLKDLSACRPDDLVVGGIGAVTQKLNDYGVTIPKINYPNELQGYLGRKIWITTIDQVINDPEMRPIFVKPIREKRFTGLVLKKETDIPRLSYCEADEPVLCSEVVTFQTEWRAFVQYGKILDVRPYFGDWRKHYDPRVIECAVADYHSDPAGYAIDFGITDDGRTLMVEVNDGFSLGCYGLAALDYAKLLAARWCELVGIHDECDTLFDGYEWRKRKENNSLKSGVVT